MSFSAYLVGTYERRFNIGTIFQIINPTVSQLKVVAAFFDDNGNYQLCVKRNLKANDMFEITLPGIPELKPQFGVVKFLSYQEDKVQLGIVGYQRLLYIEAVPGGEKTFSETVLASVSMEFAQPEFDLLRPLCPLP